MTDTPIPCPGWQCGTWEQCPNCFDENGDPVEVEVVDND